MEPQHNCSASRRGAGHRDETTAAARAGDERNMLEFIRRWHRFGGGPARDIYLQFGLAEHEFFGRTLELLQTGLFAETTDETVEYIRKVCRWRVSTAGS
jgi:hypothetical protein